MGSHNVVVSPHLDDAVLSCWHVLAGGDEVTVVNVFTGLPKPGTLGWWDRLTGAADSVERMRERCAEDAEALALVGVPHANLGLLDGQYRRNGQPVAVVDALADHLRDAGTVYAPAVLFPILDHAAVLAAALELRDDVRLYADLPHAALYGLPGWVTGEPAALDVDAAWRARIQAVGLDPDSLQPDVHALDRQAFEKKLAALSRYRTQLPAIEREAPLEALRWEVEWRR
jgi:LmbE family N-acetylglucosaminyl deacetylase